MNVIHITPADDRYSIRAALTHATDSRVLLVLPWNVEKGWMDSLDYELIFRAAKEQGLEVAWVIHDITRHPLARAAGFPLFGSEEAAQKYLARKGAFPPLRPPHKPPRPKRSWWAEEPKRPQPPRLRRQPVWLMALELGVLGVVLTVLACVAILTWPSAHIILVPRSMTHTRVVAISVDPNLTAVDMQHGIIPSRRIGDEFESYVEIGTSGRGFSYTGRAVGQVLFTNLLGQDYRVPAGTIVRTTSGSYPVRFATTQEVIIPAFGQATASIEALEEGPSGNVDPYKINLVEGVIGFAVRVTNPEATHGAQSTAVATVTQADRERAWNLAAQKVMVEAYKGLQDPAYLEAGEFLPNQALIIQATPKQAYTHMVGEQTPVLGLSLRLLVTAQAVKAADVQAIAYQQLASQLPEGYTLSTIRFEYGEAAEEDVGPGLFTFYVTAHGSAHAVIDTEKALRLVLGKSPAEATALLSETLPLAQPPVVTVKPGWSPYMPFLPIRAAIEILPTP